MIFSILHDSEGWWAATPIQGTLAIGGSANSPWEAIAMCLREGIPRAEKCVEYIDRILPLQNVQGEI